MTILKTGPSQPNSTASGPEVPLTPKLLTLTGQGPAGDPDFHLPRELRSWPIYPSLCRALVHLTGLHLPLLLRSHGLGQPPEASCRGNEGQLCWRKVTSVTSWAQWSSRDRAGSLEDSAALPIGLEESQVPRQQADAEAQLHPLKTLLGLPLSLMALHAIGPRVS